MDKKEKEILKKMLDNPNGLLSQSELISCLPDKDTKLSHSLITSGFIEETRRVIKLSGLEATFYRLTEKGRIVFKPIYKRMWFLIKGDVRTIVVSIITALVTTMMAIWITKLLNK